MQNHEASILDTPNKCNLLSQHVASPNLKLNFDATNFHILNYDVASAVELTAPHLIHCHLKGVKGMYPYNQFIVPGGEADQMDFEKLAKAFGKVGYTPASSRWKLSHTCVMIRMSLHIEWLVRPWKNWDCVGRRSETQLRKKLKQRLHPRFLAYSLHLAKSHT